MPGLLSLGFTISFYHIGDVLIICPTVRLKPTASRLQTTKASIAIGTALLRSSIEFSHAVLVRSEFRIRQQPELSYLSPRLPLASLQDSSKRSAKIRRHQTTW